jgi:DNA-binding CsgD family transcriptional regulator
MTAGTYLSGRDAECAALDELLHATRQGESRVLVIRGEPGVGKTALLDYAIDSAREFRVVRAVGVESEMELAFAGLQQLCAPLLGRLDRLPEPQRKALRGAFGLSGDETTRFLVALATLSLLSDAAEERPLLCVVDDAQWLDDASALSLAFVARRLGAESIALVFASRGPSDQLRALPELVVGGLADENARALLDSAVPGRLDEQVRDRIIAEIRGNPLALLELPRDLSAVELAGGFGRPNPQPLTERIEQSFLRRAGSLPPQSQRLLLLAAAEPRGDAALLWRAAERLGLGADALVAARDAGLIEVGAVVRFRHPLVRSAIYWSAPRQARREVHGALAESTDQAIDPDRRAWHMAEATSEPDESIAAELERSATRAQARGGLAAAAAILERSAALTPEPARRVERTLASAEAKLAAGAFEAALGLLATAQAGPLDELQRARVDLLAAEIAFGMKHGNDAPALLLQAAKRLEPLDVRRARETHLSAISAAQFAGRLARGDALGETAAAARLAPAPDTTRASDLLLDGLAVRLTDGPADAAPILTAALEAFLREDLPAEEGLRWLWLACNVALDLWDDESWEALAARHLQLARDAGALTELPLALTSRAVVHIFGGELAVAASLTEETSQVINATGSQLAPYGTLQLAAWQGRELEVQALIDAVTKEVAPRGEGIGLTVVDWTRALVGNSRGRYEEAQGAAEDASREPRELSVSARALVELIEAVSRTGNAALGTNALERLSVSTRATGTDWALGIEARCRALLSDGDGAEGLYVEALERLGRTRVKVEHARSHLLYGEWLRRGRRRRDAREHLRTACDLFAAMGLEAFAERARRELRATGETARKRTPDIGGELTAQEALIAQLAREGHSNPAIGAQLFISPRTVEYHLHKVFAKLDIDSRDKLRSLSPTRLEAPVQPPRQPLAQRRAPTTR